MGRRFGDELRGPPWDRVRDARLGLLGTPPVSLSEDAVPQAFRALLPYASLLSTGEEGALIEFWEVMTPEARHELMEAISPLVTELREFGLGTQASSPSATPKARSAERDAMLDLVRIHDLFVFEWEEGKWR